MAGADPNASTFEGLGGVRLRDVLESPEEASADEAKASLVAAASEPGTPEELLRTLHERRAKYERQLATLTEGRRAAGERALRHVDEQIARVEGGITARRDDRLMRELMRPGMDGRAARQHAGDDIAAETGVPPDTETSCTTTGGN